MGIGHMQGTPWHVEGMNLNEGEDRRHRSRCIYYNNHRCTSLGRKCIGSSHCPIYEEGRPDVNRPKYRTTYTRKFKKVTVEKHIFGSFKVKFLQDNEIGSYVIGENITSEAPIVKEIYNHNAGEKIKINNEEVLIISKDLCKR